MGAIPAQGRKEIIVFCCGNERERHVTRAAATVLRTHGCHWYLSPLVTSHNLSLFPYSINTCLPSKQLTAAKLESFRFPILHSFLRMTNSIIRHVVVPHFTRRLSQQNDLALPCIPYKSQLLSFQASFFSRLLKTFSYLDWQGGSLRRGIHSLLSPFPGAHMEQRLAQVLCFR